MSGPAADSGSVDLSVKRGFDPVKSIHVRGRWKGCRRQQLSHRRCKVGFYGRDAQYSIEFVGVLQVLWAEERAERSASARQSFVDLGCGNGLLVHILTSEGVSSEVLDEPMLWFRKNKEVYNKSPHCWPLWNPDEPPLVKLSKRSQILPGRLIDDMGLVGAQVKGIHVSDYSIYSTMSH